MLECLEEASASLWCNPESLNGKERELTATKQLPARKLNNARPAQAASSSSSSKSSSQKSKNAPGPASDGYKSVRPKDPNAWHHEKAVPVCHQDWDI